MQWIAVLYKSGRVSKRLNPYEALGLDIDATPEEIRAARRKRAKETHPDKGGDREAFEQVQTAYLILSDPLRRSKYDRDGTIDDDPSADNKHAAAVGICIAAFFAAANDVENQHGNIEQTDLMDRAAASIHQQIRGFKEHKAKEIVAYEKIKKLAARIKSKPTKRNVLQIAVERQAQDRKANADQLQNNIDNHNAALALLADHTFEFEQPEPAHYSGIDYSHGGSGGGTFFRFGVS